jgi:hypothetical protein
MGCRFFFGISKKIGNYLAFNPDGAIGQNLPVEAIFQFQVFEAFCTQLGVRFLAS